MTQDQLETYINDLQTAIAYENSKDLTGDWTKEYREGYVEGLARALELLTNNL